MSTLLQQFSSLWGLHFFQYNMYGEGESIIWPILAGALTAFAVDLIRSK